MNLYVLIQKKKAGDLESNLLKVAIDRFELDENEGGSDDSKAAMQRLALQQKRDQQ